MTYTKIPLEKLDVVRTSLRFRLKELEAVTGKKYDIRTFYFGKRSGSNRQYTLKRNATAAKIAIYESKDTSYGYYRWHDLISYV